MRTIGVAVPIPEPWGSSWQRYRHDLGDPLAMAIPTHVTLLPPTRIVTERLALVERHLIGVAAAGQPFVLHLRGTATFRPVSPVVFLAVVEGISDCEVLSAAVRTGPLASVLPFPYHPHVTLAHHLPDTSLDRAFVEMAGVDVSFPVTSFGLFEHGPDGVWRPQRDFVLGGPLPGPLPGPLRAASGLAPATRVATPASTLEA